MSQALLDVALGYLCGDRRKADAGEFWQGAIDAVRRHLEGLTTGERFAIFNASRERFGRQVNGGLRMRLWFFCHPTFEVFEDFWKDENVCRAFADHVAIVAQKSSSGHPMSRRHYKRAANAPENNAALLGSRYAKILESRFSGMMTLAIARKKRKG